MVCGRVAVARTRWLAFVVRPGRPARAPPVLRHRGPWTATTWPASRGPSVPPDR